VLASERVPEQGGESAPRSGGSFAGGAPECEAVGDLRAERALWGSSTLVLNAAHVGTWSGELSGDAAPSFPATEVRLEVRHDATGSLSFEGVAPPPAPEDAEAGYLCDGSVSGGECGSVSGFVGGFAYPLEATLSRDLVLSFSLVDADPWDVWCSRQAPRARPDPFFECGVAFEALPPGSERWSPDGCWLSTVDGQFEPIDCGRMYSLERCECARDGCIASSESRVEVGLRLTEEDELRGSLWFKNETDAASLRLQRL
jgi:hypothetical protein